MKEKQLLVGHVSAETAYVVLDYPYGFRLRCKIRYWLEFKERQGFRLVSQTTDPKKSFEYWNKAKASTYARFGGAMYLDEEGHVQWSGITEYSTTEEVQAWVEEYLEGVPEEGKSVTTGWLKAKLAYEAKKAAQEAA